MLNLVAGPAPSPISNGTRATVVVHLLADLDRRVPRCDARVPSGTACVRRLHHFALDSSNKRQTPWLGRSDVVPHHARRPEARLAARLRPPARLARPPPPTRSDAADTPPCLAFLGLLGLAPHGRRAVPACSRVNRIVSSNPPLERAKQRPGLLVERGREQNKATGKKKAACARVTARPHISCVVPRQCALALLARSEHYARTRLAS
jgi:hypothetical protein